VTQYHSNTMVIGLGFGDEGKGMVVDYLAHTVPIARNLNPLVVRFSGGHQCGHTVVIKDLRHIFANFGSGTLRGRPTYWSKYCTVDPVGLIKEFRILKEKGIEPTLYLDERCPITTPADKLQNCRNESKFEHGSCGVGFGTTIEREEGFYSLTVLDLFYPEIFSVKLKAINDYYDSACFITLETRKEFLACCDLLKNADWVRLVLGLPKFDSYIFEGSQGLLLDQHFGFFPNVTRSDTGCKNAIELLGSGDMDLFLVTRAYQTRHGNGFMSNRCLPLNIVFDPEETNKDNTRQGEFRRALLDVSLLEYAMKKDYHIRHIRRKFLVITCLDHMANGYYFTYKNQVITCANAKDFAMRIGKILDLSQILMSFNPDSDKIERIEISG